MDSLLYLDLTLAMGRKYWVSLFYHIEQVGFSRPHNGTRKSDDKGDMTSAIKDSSCFLICTLLPPVVAKYL